MMERNILSTTYNHNPVPQQLLQVLLVPILLQKHHEHSHHECITTVKVCLTTQVKQ
jgi:hypothetical protein